jgi:hypothetical protein
MNMFFGRALFPGETPEENLLAVLQTICRIANGVLF